VTDLIKWARRAANNTPADVHREGDMELTLYVDASAVGWAVVSPSGSIINFAKNWTDHDRALWSVSSSVTAEAVAIRNAVQVCVPARMRHVVICTDHLPDELSRTKFHGPQPTQPRLPPLPNVTHIGGLNAKHRVTHAG
jgi:hypothetical protein